MDLFYQFNRQISFIERSSTSYDLGNKDEALRIAVALRVLIHDTKKSTSLLSHLGKKENIQLLSTIGTGKTREHYEGKFSYSVPLMISREGVEPLLGNVISKELLSVEAWWNEVIMVQNGIFTRKDIVLSAANQDGGAHIDVTPNNKTMKLKEGVGTFTTIVNGQQVVEELIDHHFPMIRQFAYEILNSPEFISIKENT